MPLNHTPGSDLQDTKSARDLIGKDAHMRPTGVDRAESGEKKPLRLQDDPRIAEDPKVQKAVARLEVLTEARADHRVLTKAQDAVDAACIDVLEKRALILKKERETREQATKDAKRLQIEHETIHRMTGFLQVAVKIGSFIVTLHLDRAMDSTIRQHVVGDVHRLMALGVRESERVALLARVGHPVTEFPKRLIAEIKDVASRSFRAGCAEVKEIA